MQMQWYLDLTSSMLSSKFVVRAMCQVLISDSFCFDWTIMISSSNLHPVKRTVFISCAAIDTRWVLTVFVLISLSILLSYDASGRWLTALWKVNRWQENISNNHRRQRPRERDLMETDSRQSRRAAVMESVWQTKAAESFDKSLDVTWGLYSQTINQLDGFIQRRETLLLLSSSNVSISNQQFYLPSFISNTEHRGQMFLSL